MFWLTGIGVDVTVIKNYKRMFSPTNFSEMLVSWMFLSTGSPNETHEKSSLRNSRGIGDTNNERCTATLESVLTCHHHRCVSAASAWQQAFKLAAIRCLGLPGCFCCPEAEAEDSTSAWVTETISVNGGWEQLLCCLSVVAVKPAESTWLHLKKHPKGQFVNVCTT